jgi:hypothetical protein
MTWSPATSPILTTYVERLTRRDRFLALGEVKFQKRPTIASDRPYRSRGLNLRPSPPSKARHCTSGAAGTTAMWVPSRRGKAERMTAHG